MHILVSLYVLFLIVVCILKLMRTHILLDVDTEIVNVVINLEFRSLFFYCMLLCFLFRIDVM